MDCEIKVPRGDIFKILVAREASPFFFLLIFLGAALACSGGVRLCQARGVGEREFSVDTQFQKQWSIG